MTNGEVLRVRAAMKPISTVPRALRTLDIATGEQAVAIHQRSDVCAVPAAGVVAEAMVALVLAEPRWRSSAATRFPRPAATSQAYLATSPSAVCGSVATSRGAGRDGSASVVLVGPPGSGQDVGRPGAGPALGRDCGTPTPTSRPRAGRPIPDIFVTDGEPVFRAWSEAATARAARPPGGVLALGGGAILADRPGRRWPGTAWSGCRCPPTQAADRVGLDSNRPLLPGNSAGRLQGCWTARRRSTTRSATDRRCAPMTAPSTRSSR